MSLLCLKDEAVAELRDENSVPVAITNVKNPELLPVFLQGNTDDRAFRKWLSERSIPEKREGLDEVKKQFGTDWMTNKNYASLSDHYWIKWRDEKWKKVSFFTTRYSPIVGNMFFEPWEVQGRIKGVSPDLTTGGILKKCWRQNSDMSSYLVKAGSKAARQEPLSEVLVAVLCERLQIPCVHYELYIEGTTMCCRCDNIVTLDTELVPASDIYFKTPRKDGETVYSHLLKMCEQQGIDAKKFLDQMIFVDNITGNEDRNLSNIGFIRDVNTMKFIGPAPIFDSGNAYYQTDNVNNAVKSTLFGDVENEIVAHMKKEIDLDALTKSKDHKHMIMTYPDITDKKKENLINAIHNRNTRLSMNFEYVRT